MAEPSPDSPEIRWWVSNRWRQSSRLHGLDLPAEPPQWPVDVAAMVRQHPDAWGWTLWGGEPTLSSTLPAQIAALHGAAAPRIGLATDGWLLTRRQVVDQLASAGLSRVRIPLHASSSEAHDWLVGAKGAASRARKAIRVCVAAGMKVEVTATVTRSTSHLLEQTVGLVAALGAHRMDLVRPRLDGTNWRESVALSPRLGLSEPHLQQAVRAGRRAGLGMHLTGFPRCAAPGLDPHRRLAEAVRWQLPQGPAWQALGEQLQATHAPGCARCVDSCPGAPADYIARFGRAELDSVGTQAQPMEPRDGLPLPPSRDGWLPATRVLSATRRALAGPEALRPSRTPRVVAVQLDADESSRAARKRLVQASQERPEVLRLSGAWGQHEDALSLLVDARLFLPELELAGPLDALVDLPDRILKRLHHLARVYAPNDENPELLARLRALGVDVQHSPNGGTPDVASPEITWSRHGRVSHIGVK